MRIELKHLAVEITRKCNMKCAHCMRGEPQEISMSNSIIQKLCQSIHKIDRLTITGGEPSLAAEELKNMLHWLKINDVKIGYFICLTNAKEHNPHFIEIITDLYKYCMGPDKCELSVSLDQFHEPTNNKAMEVLKELPFFKETPYTDIPENQIVNYGRAEKNGLGSYSLSLNPFIYFAKFDGVNLSVSDTVFVNALGDVLLCADMSYENQEKHSIGNLSELDLELILIRSLYPLSADYEKYIWRVSIISDGCSRPLDTLSEEMYFKDERIAYGSFYRIIANLQDNLSAIRILLGLGENNPSKLTVKSEDLENSHFDPNFCIGEILSYSLNDDTVAKLEICLEQFELEDDRYE